MISDVFNNQLKCEISLRTAFEYILFIGLKKATNCIGDRDRDYICTTNSNALFIIEDTTLCPCGTHVTEWRNYETLSSD